MKGKMPRVARKILNFGRAGLHKIRKLKNIRFLTTKNTVFFSSCNNSYIANSAASLLSIRKFLPKAKLYIFSRDISEENREILKKNAIEFIDIDLRGKFFRHWDYPAECYYIFAGPEVFLEKGFKYSVYIDGDILCLRNPLNPLRGAHSVAGVSGRFYSNGFGIFPENEHGAIKEIFKLSDEDLSRPRITSSVVYFNNKRMREIGLLDTAAVFFKISVENDIPRKGDDSLFSLIQFTKLAPNEVRNVPNCNNFTPVDRKIAKKSIFLHFVERKPWGDFEPTGDLNSEYIERWRKIKEKSFASREDSASRAEDEKHEKSRIKNLEKKGLILPEEQRCKNSKKRPIKTFICEKGNGDLKNFGDQVQRDIIPIIFGYRVEPCLEIAEAELFSVGSIMYILTEINISHQNYIWGSGFISEEEVKNEAKNLKKVVISAVRGKNTLARVKKATGTSGLPLGDPGLLASIIYPENKTKNGKIGVVVHYVDTDNPVVETLHNDPRFLIIDVLDSPRDVAHQISGCFFVISSSLHGLIFADSYGIPNAHIRFSDKVTGGEYKFKDYDSAIGKSHLEFDIQKIKDTKYIEELKSEYRPIRNLEAIQKRLVDAFPFQ